MTRQPRTARLDCADRSDLSLWCESTDSRDMLDSSDRALIDEPIDSNDANDPTLPIRKVPRSGCVEGGGPPFDVRA